MTQHTGPNDSLRVLPRGEEPSDAAGDGWEGKAPPGNGGQHPVLEFQGVWFSYALEPVLQDITLSVNRGDFVAILGPNGSGKTSLLRLALGLERATRGRVLLFGQPPDRLRTWKSVGYVPQIAEGIQERFPATVEEVVAQGLYQGLDPLAFFRRSHKAEVLEALESVGLTPLAGRRISALSVGQQQRALIARALVRQAELLVLDEPVAGVDTAGQEQFYSLLHRLNQEQGITVVLVSHDIGAMLREATTCACLNRTLVFHGPTHSLTSNELSQLYGLPVEVLLHDVLHEHR
ncbi:MAG: metal ABC transporter ATP-binding protein [Chloroflexi bacterium]|nr:metal ABC transporter ATP-binding protein [Chloroflexota bacterium]